MAISAGTCQGRAVLSQAHTHSFRVVILRWGLQGGIFQRAGRCLYSPCLCKSLPDCSRHGWTHWMASGAGAGSMQGMNWGQIPTPVQASVQQVVIAVGGESYSWNLLVKYSPMQKSSLCHRQCTGLMVSLLSFLWEGFRLNVAIFCGWLLH